MGEFTQRLIKQLLELVVYLLRIQIFTTFQFVVKKAVVSASHLFQLQSGICALLTTTRLNFEFLLT